MAGIHTNTSSAERSTQAWRREGWRKEIPEGSGGEAMGEGAEEEVGAVDEDHHAGAPQDEQLEHLRDHFPLSFSLSLSSSPRFSAHDKRQTRTGHGNISLKGR